MKQIFGKLIKFRTFEEHLESNGEEDFVVNFEMNYIFVENKDNFVGTEIVGVAYFDDGIAYAVNGVVDYIDENNKYIECLLVSQNDCYSLTYYNCNNKYNTIIRKVEFTEGKDILTYPQLFCYGKTDVKTITPETFMFPEELAQKHDEIKEMSNENYNGFADYLFTDGNVLYNYTKEVLKVLGNNHLCRFVSGDKTQFADSIEMYVIVKSLINDFSSTIVNSATLTETGDVSFDEKIEFNVENKVRQKVCEQLKNVDEYQLKYIMAAAVNALTDYYGDEYPNAGLCLADYVLNNDNFAEICEEDGETLILLGVMETVKNPKTCVEWLDKFKEIGKVDEDVVEKRLKTFECCKDDEEITNFMYAYELLKLDAEQKNKSIEEIIKHMLLVFGKYEVEFKRSFDKNEEFDNMSGYVS